MNEARVSHRACKFIKFFFVIKIGWGPVGHRAEQISANSPVLHAGRRLGAHTHTQYTHIHVQISGMSSAHWAHTRASSRSDIEDSWPLCSIMGKNGLKWKTIWLIKALMEDPYVWQLLLRLYRIFLEVALINDQRSSATPDKNSFYHKLFNGCI